MSDFLKNVPKGSEGDDVNNPLKSAQIAMQPELPKRFYKDVEISETDGSFSVTLDSRSIKTPGKNPIEVATRDLADILRQEWDDQLVEINPVTMPATRIVNTAIDGIAQDIQPVLEDIVKFAGTDLVCYRAAEPSDLVELQNAHWDPVVDWARDDLGANFILIEGLIHSAQPKEAISLFGARLRQYRDAVSVACIHTFTSLTGSALIALALAENQLSLDEAWSAAHVDEDWNIERWGEDEEAASRRTKRHFEMSAAYNVLKSVG